MGIYAKKYPDILCFGEGSGGKITNEAMALNLSRFLQANSPAHRRFKQDYFTVLIHGWVSGTSSSDTAWWEPGQLCNEIKKYWNSGSDRRALCLLSCLTGYGISRKVSRLMGRPVVAPQSIAYINQVGQFISSDWDKKMQDDAKKMPYNIQERTQWTFCDMEGNIQPVTTFPVLQFKEACELAEKWIGGQ